MKLFKTTSKISDTARHVDLTLNMIQQRQSSRRQGQISVQIVRKRDNQRNSVLFVTPNGHFFRESIVNLGKILIALRNHQNLLPITLYMMDPFAHLNRYLNLRLEK